ncbi:MAG TPA: ABC transporter permease [Bryobacteraceae bacterium]|nr:ABC transporter permease [Bryobacteraceae bacterium]
MLNVLPDLRFAFRSIRKSPGFAAVAVLTLALGVGCNTAVFSLVNAVLLRPMPYFDPGRLVLVWESAPFFGLSDSPVAPANYADWKARSRSFEEMGALEDHSYRLVGEGTPEIVQGSQVTASLLRALRVHPVRGRLFRDDEDRPGAPKVALISEGFWRRRFDADPRITGSTLTLNDEKHVIVGVLPSGKEPPSEYSGTMGEIWTPLGSGYSAQELANRGRHNWMVVARLRSGVSLAEADAEMKTIGVGLAREYPATNEKVGAFVAPMRDHFVSSRRRVLLLLLGTVAFVLLIACANVANLLLARATARTKEVAVRAALGAGAWQLIRQFLCESLLLCAAATAIGLAVATATFRFLAHFTPSDIAGLNALSIDWRVLVFALAISAATLVVFGLVPLHQVRRLDLNQSLKDSARSLAAGSGSRGLRGLLVCSEVALAFMLLIGAGLLIQTFMRLRSVDLGCRTNNILTLQIPPSAAYRDPGRRIAYQGEILRRITAIPGVISAGFTNHIPLVVKGDISGIGAEGRGAKERFQCRTRVAGPGYLRTMGIPLHRGRDIDERDIEGAPLVVLINQTLARTLWPNQDPIGRRIHFTSEVSASVIGVTGDIRQAGLDVPPQPEFYVSALQAGFPVGSLAIHSSVEPATLAAQVRRTIWSVDPNQPITELASMQDILDKEVFQRRVQTMLLAFFAGLALLLAAIGVYGVLAHLVGQQTSEIGLRMALGATPSDVAFGVVVHGLRLTAIGLAFGVAGALAVSRLLTTLLFGVKPTDPATYAIVAAALLLTAAIASYLPAHRAMRVDPIVALSRQ